MSLPANIFTLMSYKSFVLYLYFVLGSFSRFTVFFTLDCFRFSYENIVVQRDCLWKEAKQFYET